jgi:biopolymer transport protein ExbD
MTFLLLIDGNTEYQQVVDIIYEIKQQKIENFSFKLDGE